MKKDIFLCIAVVGMLAFTACNSSTQTASQQSSVEITSEESSKAETSDNKPDKEDNSTIAKVTAVTDHSISVVAAKMPEGKPDDNGTQPDKKDNSNGPSDSEKPSAPPESNAPEGNAPEGNAPAPKDKDNSQGHSLEFNTDETLIEIPDESILYTRDKETETDCSLSDIKVDDVVRIKYSDDGVTPEKIVVMTQSAPAGESETQTASAN